MNFLTVPALVLMCLVLAACQPASDEAVESVPSADSAALLVSVETAVQADRYEVEREFIGRVEATRRSAAGFELGGELAEVLVDEGDLVAAGDALARLDKARLKARLAEARAALAQARSASDLAARTLTRSEEAAGFDGISDQELDAARQSAAAARASVAAARARVNTVEVDLDKSTLEAPYDAVVVARRIDEGNIVAAGTPILELQERAAPQVRLGVSGEFAATLETGEARTVFIGEESLRGTVRAVLPVRDPATRTVDVILQFEEGARAVPGDLVRMPVQQVIEQPGFWLPVDALSEGSRGLWTVYVVRPQSESGQVSASHTAEPRVVDVLHKQDARVFVRGALSDGERFVRSGTHRIVPNQLVRVADEGGAEREVARHD